MQKRLNYLKVLTQNLQYENNNFPIDILIWGYCIIFIELIFKIKNIGLWQRKKKK